jgi:hypothetical protein
VDTGWKRTCRSEQAEHKGAADYDSLGRHGFLSLLRLRQMLRYCDDFWTKAAFVLDCFRSSITHFLARSRSGVGPSVALLLGGQPPNPRSSLRSMGFVCRLLLLSFWLSLYSTYRATFLTCFSCLAIPFLKAVRRGITTAVLPYERNEGSRTQCGG